jgi:lysophospholipase L1-like esterase
MRCSIRSRMFTAVLAFTTAGGAAAQTQGLPWIGSWSAAASAQTTNDNASLPTFTRQTLRQYVFTSIGGQAVRLHFSNQYGTAPLTLADVHVGQSDSVGNIVPGTDSPVTFAGSTTVVIPAGGSIISDGAAEMVPANAYLAVSAYFPGTTPVTAYTTHVFTEQGMQLVPGDASGVPAFTNPSYPTQYFFLTSVDVQNPDALGAVATIGASITDGYNSSFNANHRWSNDLSARFQALGLTVGVLNQGIAGADLLQDSSSFYGEATINRFMRDVVDQPGVRWVIHTEFNDLGTDNAPTLIAAEQTLMAQAHVHHINYVCSTFPPVNAAGGYEATRQQLNAFLRTPGNGCDGLVDQDKALRDADNPAVLAPAYFGTSDGVHPNDAGYEAIAEAVDLGLFNQPTPLVLASPSTDCAAGWTAGQTIDVGTQARSCDQRFSLALQGDGNLVLYQGGQPLWATMTTMGEQVARGEMLHNGNFALYDDTGKAVWATNSEGHPGAHLLLQNDGNLVIYDAANSPVWNTGTQR